eukprot:jgi/Chrzof1/3781/Cz13g08160.t1
MTTPNATIPEHCRHIRRRYDVSFLGDRLEAQAGNVTYAYHRFGPLPNRIEGGPYEALVLIMGFTADMYNWHPQMLRRLAAQREVVIFDNIGVGYTTLAGGINNNTILTIPFMADSTMELLNAIGLDTPSIMGASMGGMIALTMVTRNGSQLSSVIAQSTSAGGPAALMYPDVNTTAMSIWEVLFPGGDTDPGEGCF